MHIIAYMDVCVERYRSAEYIYWNIEHDSKKINKHNDKIAVHIQCNCNMLQNIYLLKYSALFYISILIIDIPNVLLRFVRNSYCYLTMMIFQPYHQTLMTAYSLCHLPWSADSSSYENRESHIIILPTFKHCMSTWNIRLHLMPYHTYKQVF